VAKLRVRIAPVVLAERADGRDAAASLVALGSWLALILGGAEFADTDAAAIAAASRKPRRAAIEALVRIVEPRLLDDQSVMALLGRLATQAGAE
jgi:fructuronate reductase